MADIVDYSTWWNTKVAVTGALLFTETDFSQYIEGPKEAVCDLIGKIRQDSRHADMMILREEDIADRRFEGWALAYSGPKMFLADELREPFDRSIALAPDVRADRLLSLMLALADHGDHRVSYSDGALRL